MISTYRGSFAEINYSSFEYNMKTIKGLCDNKKVLLSIKANAYGHGAVELGKYAEDKCLADYFGVATIEEALELRQANLKTPILLLGFFLPSENALRHVIKNKITVSLCDYSFAQKLNEQAKIYMLTVMVYL